MRFFLMIIEIQTFLLFILVGFSLSTRLSFESSSFLWIKNKSNGAGTFARYDNVLKRHKYFDQFYQYVFYFLFLYEPTDRQKFLVNKLKQLKEIEESLRVLFDGGVDVQKPEMFETTSGYLATAAAKKLLDDMYKPDASKVRLKVNTALKKKVKNSKWRALRWRAHAICF